LKLDFPCKHCHKDLTIDTDKMKVIDSPKEIENIQQQQSTQLLKPEVKEVIKEVVKTQTGILKTILGQKTKNPRSFNQQAGKIPIIEANILSFKSQIQELNQNFDEQSNNLISQLGISLPNIGLPIILIGGGNSIIANR